MASNQRYPAGGAPGAEPKVTVKQQTSTLGPSKTIEGTLQLGGMHVCRTIDNRLPATLRPAFAMFALAACDSDSTPIVPMAAAGGGRPKASGPASRRPRNQTLPH